jgi:hypothetical protein
LDSAFDGDAEGVKIGAAGLGELKGLAGAAVADAIAAKWPGVAVVESGLSTDLDVLSDE